MDICVIGVGNELREDDGVGLAVVAALQNRVLRGKADFYNIGLDLFTLPDLIGQYRFVFIVDALPPGLEPGKVMAISWYEKHVERGKMFSLHDLDLLWQLNVVLNLKQEFMSKIWLIGIETASAKWGNNLSPKIKIKLKVIIEEITRKITTTLENAMMINSY